MTRTAPARVGVAIASPETGRTALDAAAQLAAALDAELTALFMEDVDLVRAAALPGLREMGAVSGLTRPIEAGEMRRALRAHADLARSAVAKAARATGVLWSFEVLRGSGMEAICELHEAMDMLVFGEFALRHAAMPFSPWPVAFVPAAHRAARHPVAVVLQDAAHAAPALRAAHALADRFEAPLLVIVCGADARAVESLRAAAKAAFDDVAAPVRYATLRECSATALNGAVREHKAQLVICSDGGLRRDRQRLETLLGQLPCPLVLAD